jgi:ribose transport system substrate-binding protein
MKNWYLLLMSLVAAFVLYIALSLFYGERTQAALDLERPVEIVLKSIQTDPMDFWDVAMRGIAEASREFGVEVHLSGPRFEREINRQIRIVKQVVETRPPLIILAASDYRRLAEPLERAEELGIPVITFDSGVDSTVPVSFIATDNIEAGYKAGREMKRLIDGADRKQIAIVSHIRETATAIDREAGVRQALEGENIIGTWFCDVDEDIAYRITTELLTNPQLGGIVALNEVATLGVARAIDDRNARDKVLVVGFDNAVRELSYLEQGVIKATVVQRPYNMGYLVVKTAAACLRGEKVAPFIDTGSILITKENMFQREYQELLFPFTEP